MRVSVPITLLGSMLVATIATPVELAPYGANSDTALLDERSVAACATCVGQCVLWLGLCTAVCGPWSEIFTGPLPCTECLVIAGASQQCFQCVQTCEGDNSKKRDEIGMSPVDKRNDPKYLMFSSCAGSEFTDNTCNGINDPSVGEYGGPGICTMSGYSKQGSSGVGVNCPAGQECDVAVGPTSNCAPVATE